MLLQLKSENGDTEGSMLREQESFYLSWSNYQKAFGMKKLTKDQSLMLPGFVEVEVSHISSAFGQVENILIEIKQHEPKDVLQCIVGKIATICETTLEYEIGDEVIAFLASKWVRSRVRIPVGQIFKKPLFLSKKLAAVTSGMLLLCYPIT